MCGIWALFGCDDDSLACYSSCMAIAHRGPDQFRIENVTQAKNCKLGFHRLSILDHNNGMQPMKIKSLPHLVVIYNGEIYNCKQLGEQYKFNYETECDTESILHLYAKGGAEFATSQLDGVFSFCLIDLAERKIHLARDTFGVRPMFKSFFDGKLAICSEMKGITGLLENKYARIHPLKPGHLATYRFDMKGHVSFESEVQFNSVGQSPKYTTLTPKIVEDDVLANIRCTFTNAVKKRLQSQRRIGCMLSGGLDSSLVAGLVTKLAKESGIEYPLQTFSIGMEGSPDVIAAHKVADFIDSEHYVIEFTAEEGIEALEKTIYHLESYDITTIRASVGMYLLSKFISNQSESIVIFSGEGSDELAQGYIYFHNAPDPEAADAESRRLLEDLHMFDVCRADRTTNAHGLELRVPFLDHQFTSYYLSLPHDTRVPRDKVEKYLLRKAFDGQGIIPDEILWRPKEAFSDGISSHKKSWFEYLQDHIDEKVTDVQMEDAPKTFPVNPPRTKEAYFYRQIYEKYYPGQQWINYYWMPKWSDATDPSARTLSHYKPENSPSQSSQSSKDNSPRGDR